MKRLAKILSFVLVSVLLLSYTVMAAPSKQSLALPDDASVNRSSYTPNDVQQMGKVHKMVVKRGLASLNSDGTIVINTNAIELGVNENLFTKYLKNISETNFAVEEGVLSIDKDFNVKIASSEQITKSVSDKDEQKKTSLILPMYDPTAPPALNAYSKAVTNRTSVKNVYNSAYASGSSTASCFSIALAYWVAKVRPGGAWDYKSVTGYSPYYKEWTARTRYITSIETSEWFGNYQYGLTGRYLFSLSTLLHGGYFAGMGSEEQNDINAITWGYNEY